MSAVAVAPAEPHRVFRERALDDVIVGAWEDLTAHHAVACPVCGGEMQPEYGARARPIQGRCAGCGSTLS